MKKIPNPSLIFFEQTHKPISGKQYALPFFLKFGTYQTW